MKKRFSKFGVSVAAGLMLMGGLAGCGEVSVEVKDGKSEPSVEVQDGDAPLSDYGVVTKEVEPGQFVTCVVYASHQEGGLSCDWEGYHAEYDTPSDS